MTTREQAMQWWDNLPDLTITTEINKSALTKKYKGQFRMYASLTGSEIEFIWSKVVEPQLNIYLNRLKEQYKVVAELDKKFSRHEQTTRYLAMRLFCLDTQLLSINAIENMQNEVNSQIIEDRVDDLGK